MGKTFLLVLLIAVVWLLLRNKHRPRQAPAPAARPFEPMAACAHCGVNQPRSECVASRLSADRWFCSEAHRTAAEGDVGQE